MDEIKELYTSLSKKLSKNILYGVLAFIVIAIGIMYFLQYTTNAKNRELDKFAQSFIKEATTVGKHLDKDTKYENGPQMLKNYSKISTAQTCGKVNDYLDSQRRLDCSELDYDTQFDMIRFYTNESKFKSAKLINVAKTRNEYKLKYRVKAEMDYKYYIEMDLNGKTQDFKIDSPTMEIYINIKETPNGLAITSHDLGTKLKQYSIYYNGSDSDRHPEKFPEIKLQPKVTNDESEGEVFYGDSAETYNYITNE